MKKKNDINVMIDGREYTLCGYESNDYLQSVANYINSKIRELKNLEGYSRLDADMRNLLLELNIADDYYKAKSKVDELEDSLKQKEKELFEIKHNLASMQTKAEETKKEIETLKAESVETQKKIVRLETELEEREKK